MDFVYGAFTDYFGDIKMKKIKQENGYTVYATQTGTGLLYYRYIYAIVPTSPIERDVETLMNLDWVSLQTRSTPDVLDVPKHEYTLTEKHRVACSDKLTCVNRTQDRTEYNTTMPIKITLLHDPKKHNILQYPDTCLLYHALETYQCIIELM